MADELSRGKSVCILAVVVGCFAILWPNILYPMLKNSFFASPAGTNGCCHVLHDKDANGVKLVSELCNAVFRQSETHQHALNLSLANRSPSDPNIKHCRAVILDTCGVDIHVLLKDKIQLDPRYKQTLDELRTFNKSLCLKYHFDVTLELLGAPHRVKYNYTATSKYHLRQERSPYTRPNGMHPVLRDRGKSSSDPQAQQPPQMNVRAQREKETAPPPSVIAGKKPPIPGMRPPIGAGSHIQSNKRGEGGGGTMGFLLPMYTTGIVLFFGYTMMKFMCRKSTNSNDNYSRDPDFCRIVFNNNNARESRSPSLEKSNGSLPNEPSSPKLGDVEIDLLRKRLAETEATMERIVKQMNLVSQTLPKPLNEIGCSESKVEAEEVKVNGDVAMNDTARSTNEVLENQTKPIEKEKAVIEVVGMELSEHCENGEPWTKQIPASKVSNLQSSPSATTTPQEILLQTNVPANSRILITDAHTHNVAEEPSVILESKVTLNVIAPERHEETSDSENEIIDDRNRSSKIDVSEEAEEEIDEEEIEEEEEEEGEEEGEEEEGEVEEVEEEEEEEEEEIEEDEEVEVEEVEYEETDDEQNPVQKTQKTHQTTEI